MTLYQAMAAQPDPNTTLGSSIAMCSLYRDRLDAQAVAQSHRSLFAPVGQGARSRGSFQSEPLARRRIWLGMLSADFHHQHPVNMLMQPVLRELSTSRFELFVYFAGGSYDAKTRSARAHAEHRVEVSTLNSTRVARLMDRDRLDLQMDLAGHTDAQRGQHYAQRAAPCKPCTWATPALPVCPIWTGC